jgi:predicted amino acid racemase
MAYLEIRKNSIYCNTQVLYDFCKKHEIRLCPVTKCCYSEEEIITLLYNMGINEFADSNMENFNKLPANLSEKLYKSVIKTRLTDILSIPYLASYIRPQRVFISDGALLDALVEIPADICPDIMLIIEIGDFKDGFYPSDISSICKKYRNLPIIGVSANYACLSGIMPCKTSSHELSRLASEIKTKNDILPLVSLGGTVAYQLFNDEEISKGSNLWEFRCGEGIFLGYDSATGKNLPGFKQDVFRLFGEIVEIRRKKYTEPVYKGHSATGENTHTCKDSTSLNMVLDFGVLAAPAKNLIPLDTSANIIGQTFDFTVVDITNSSVNYKTGHYFGFVPNYGGVSTAMLNKYIKKVYV